MATAKNIQAVQMPTAQTQAVRTPEQQAEIDKLRAEKAKAAPTAEPQAEENLQVVHLNARLLKGITALADILYPEDDGQPQFTWKRRLAAFFGSILLAGGAGYLIGQLAGYAMLGCYALTGSAFLMYTILFIALILAAYAGFKIGQHVGNYILSGQIDRDCVAMKDKVFGWFKSKPKAAVAA